MGQSGSSMRMLPARVTDERGSGSAQMERPYVDVGVEGGSDQRARCSERDSEISRSMSHSLMPSAFALSAP